MSLWYEALVSLDTGAVCPQCNEGRLESNVNILVCPVCGYNAKPVIRRFSLRYPLIPSVEGYDVFTRVHVNSRETEYAMFALDIDTNNYSDAEQAYSVLTDVAGSVVQLYSSGSKGYHLVIPLEVWAYSNPNWPYVFRNVVSILNIPADYSIYKHKGMLRAPDTVNTKTGQRKTLLRNAKSTSISKAWLELIKQAEVAIQPRTGSSTVTDEPWFYLQNFNPPCITKLWLYGLPYKGSRYLSYLHLISYYLRRGDAEQEALNYLIEFASIHNDNTNASEIVRINSATRMLKTAYKNGLSFVCRRGKDLGICEESCPLFKN